jgi:hypothetical protein
MKRGGATIMRRFADNGLETSPPFEYAEVFFFLSKKPQISYEKRGFFG